MKGNYLKILIFAVVCAVLVSGLVVSGMYKKTLVKDSSTTQTPQANSQSVSLASGAVTFEAPQDYSVTPIYNNRKVFAVEVVNTQSGDVNHADLLVTAYAGTATGNGPDITKFSDQNSSVTTDDSLIPADNTFATTQNTKAYIEKIKSKVSSPSLPWYAVYAKTQLQLRFADDQTRPTVVMFFCQSNDLSSNPPCHDLVKQALATLKITEPLPLPGAVSPTQ